MTEQSLVVGAAHGEVRTGGDRRQHHRDLDQAVPQRLQQHHRGSGRCHRDCPARAARERALGLRRRDREWSLPERRVRSAAAGSFACLEGSTPAQHCGSVEQRRRLVRIHLHGNPSADGEPLLQGRSGSCCFQAGVARTTVSLHHPALLQVVQSLTHHELTGAKRCGPVHCGQLVALAPATNSVHFVAAGGAAGHAVVTAVTGRSLVRCRFEGSRGGDEERFDTDRRAPSPPDDAQRSCAGEPHLHRCVHPSAGCAARQQRRARRHPPACHDSLCNPQLGVRPARPVRVHVPRQGALGVGKVCRRHGVHRDVADGGPATQQAGDEGNQADGDQDDHRRRARQECDGARDQPCDPQRRGTMGDADRAVQRLGACTAAMHSATTSAACARSLPAMTRRCGNALSAARAMSCGAT